MSQPTQEQWLPVVGYEGIYEVSDHGRVRSVLRSKICSNGVTRTVRGRLLSPTPRKNGGHLQVQLYTDWIDPAEYVDETHDGWHVSNGAHRYFVERAPGRTVQLRDMGDSDE